MAASNRAQALFPDCSERLVILEPTLMLYARVDHAKFMYSLDYASNRRCFFALKPHFLLKRVFDFDVERCGCGGKLKVIAAIEEPAVIERILTHLGLSAQPPPRTPARRVDLFQAA